MFELQHFTDGVDFLVEWDTAHHATQLAASLKVPLMAAGDLADRPQTATLHLP